MRAVTDEDADHHRPLSKKSRTSSASSRLFSWFSSSHRIRSDSSLSNFASNFSSGPKASTGASSFSEEPKLGIYEDVWDKLSDPLSVVLLYILQNTVAEIAITHHQDLSGLCLPESQTMEEFMGNLNRIKPKIMVEDGRTPVAMILVSEGCPIHHNSTESTHTSNSTGNSTGQRSICNNDIANSSDLRENIREGQSPNTQEEWTEHRQIPIRPVTSRKLPASHTILYSQIPVNRIARRWIPEFPKEVFNAPVSTASTN
ncbi:hypothetical protein M422DRAFT_47907 [Sphaerobolus stellatus SS14]|uniref:Uncharacterized protein n=1 Tax=Sphaerobolus stellatus (strain SS14) TaxID=990650 RepID=A0A0C9UJF9_SPHS4|nr:hypothetical protein M422DRAFT_47907 [Sphaerobolus stellatus SS14]